MKKGAGRKLAYVTVAGFILGAGGFALSTILTSRSGPITDRFSQEVKLEAPPPDAEAAKVVTDLIEASNALGRIQKTISAKTSELFELEELIQTRQNDLETLEAALDAKGVELDRIVRAVREQDYDALVGLDLDIAKMGPEQVNAAAAGPGGDLGSPDFSGDIEKIREIIQDAKVKADPAIAASGDSVLVQIIFESGSADLTVGGLTRAMAAAQVISELEGQLIRIAAFTDTVGSADANDRLSRARAETVARVFADAGVHPDVIEIVAAGEDPTRLPVTTADGVSEPLNRSVEVYPVSLMN
jgi:outer membrane protein OmpA-like peptidoglycan-associated protein